MEDLIRVQVLDIDEDLRAVEKNKERFRIENTEQADWAFRIIRKAKERKKETQEMYDRERERIDNWKKKEDTKSDNDIIFMEGLLIEYFEKQRVLDEKFRLSTPNGKVTSRKMQDKWEYQEDVLLKHLKENELEEFIRVKEEIDKSSIKKAFVKDGIDVYDTNGGVVKGIKVYKQPDSIKVVVEEV